MSRVLMVQWSLQYHYFQRSQVRSPSAARKEGSYEFACLFMLFICWAFFGVQIPFWGITSPWRAILCLAKATIIKLGVQSELWRSPQAKQYLYMRCQRAGFYGFLSTLGGKRDKGRLLTFLIPNCRKNSLYAFFRAQRRWRKAVTGDPDKRIRDHMKETPQVKLLDKMSFTLGVVVICLSEFLILR